jgi:hypothetical protein
MSFDDRTADRESHAHAAGFGGEERVEQLVRVLDGDPDTAILHCYQHLVRFVLMRSDHQFARPIRDRLHRFDAVHDQVDDHLLQLDRIAEDHGQSVRELHPQRHSVTDQLTPHQRDDLCNEVIDVERPLFGVGLFRKRTDALDHLARPFAIVDDRFHGAAWTSALARAVTQYKPTDVVLETIDRLQKHYRSLEGRPFEDECSNKPYNADGENNISKQLIPDTWEDLVKATQQIMPRIMKGEPEAERFAEIFRTAPISILKATQIALDAKLLGFDIPDLSAAPKIGLDDEVRWPLLPSGVMTEVSPIAAQVTDISTEDCLFVVETANKPLWEWTRKDRLLMFEICERLLGRKVDPALRAKIMAQKWHDDLFSELHQIMPSSRNSSNRSPQSGQQGGLASRRHRR